MKRLERLYDDQNASAFLRSMLVFGIAVGLFSALLNNYLHEVLRITRLERGIIELPRELPGLLLVLIVAAFSRFSEYRLMTGAFIACAAGLAGLAILGDSRIPAVMLIVLWSTGEHVMMPIRDSIGMHMAKPGKIGAAMGGVSVWMNVGQVAGSYAVPAIFLLVPTVFGIGNRTTLYRITFFMGSIILAAALFFSSRIRSEKKLAAREKLTFRKKYLRYYILEVFYGARKQIFLTFAPYVLIMQYGAKTEYVAFLFGFWSLSNIVAAPVMGKLLDRFGYRKIIITDAVLIIFVCILYGFSHRIWNPGTAFFIVSAVFVLDAVLFLTSMARSMYVKSVARDQNEVTSTLSTGISVNHLVSIIIAVLGGLLWERLGMETLFSIAAFLGLGSLVFSIALPGKKAERTATAG